MGWLESPAAAIMIAAAILLLIGPVFGFVSSPLSARPISKTVLQMNYGRQVPRKNIRLPLLVDNTIGNEQPRWNIPLPNAHLPAELTTASLYELELDRVVHKMVISQAVSSYDSDPESGCCYGHIVWKGDDLVGAIGCAGEVLIGASAPGVDVPNEIESLKNVDPEDTGPLMVLARGAYRFKVKEVVSTIPYPTAVVDELLDDDISDNSSKSIKLDEDDDYDTDMFAELSPKELIKATLESLDKVLQLQYDDSFKPLSPLEQSILENADSPEPMAQAITRTFDAEERIAVYQTFVSKLLDIVPDERDRCFAVAMIAGELANFSPKLRAKMLTTTDGVNRLRLVLQELFSVLDLDAAKRMTKSITLGVKEKKAEKEQETGAIPDYDGIGTIYNDFEDTSSNQFVSAPSADSIEAAEEAHKELKVGVPSLPPWANQIRDGVRVEYFWNEEEGWCAGTVVGDPIRIMNEYLITVEFDDDGSVHRLSLRGEDKARWRPP
ncbi:hypothetical protein ACHAWO_003389 [Cyclotella atomus]|uniref:Uncharacterized protein n=1 Tax=Cyclotella atomus TaxID=382360 RepID=A0ABD3NL95_9STRA